MAYQLTDEEKKGIIDARLKSIESSIYDVQLSVEEENSIQSPSADILASLSSRLTDLNARKAVLEAKLEELE